MEARGRCMPGAGRLSKMGTFSGLLELDQQLPGVMTSSIGGLTHLQSLSIQNNSVHGTIPAEIGACHRLRRVELDQNFINGSLPLSLSMLQGIPIRWFSL